MHAYGITLTLRRWSRSARGALVALVLGLACTLVHGQPRGELSAEAQAIYTRWLASTCIAAEEGALAEALTRYARELVPAFRRAIATGPSAEALNAVREAAQIQYEQRAKFAFDPGQIVGVAERDLAAFRRVPRERYVADQVQRYATGYRANAVAGLGAIGGIDARATLSRLAANPRDPLAAAAREALRALRGTPQPR